MLSAVSLAAVRWRSGLLCGALLSLAACGGAGETGLPLAPDPAREVTQTLYARAAGVSVELVAACAPGGGVDGITLDAGNGSELGLSLALDGARGLRAWTLEVRYDADQLDPLELRATPLLGAPAGGAAGGTALDFSHLGEAGRAALSQALLQASRQPGFSGSGELAVARFARRPFVQRAAADAPVGPASQAVVSLSNATRTLTWRYYSQGDYDQNSETNIADLRPIAENFKQTGSFLPDSLEAVVDGDSNGEINAADLKSIATNYRRAVDGYHVYVSASLADVPAAGAPSTIPFAAEVLFNAAQGDSDTGRLAFSHTFPALADHSYVWVRPFHGAHEGAVSTTAQFNAPNQPPLAALVSDLQQGEVPLSVQLDASGSSDPDGTITKYEFDCDGAGAAYGFVDNGASPVFGFTYPAEGSYTPEVRVTDDRSTTATVSLATPIVVEPVQQLDPPVAAFSANPSGGAPPLDVVFDASASSDPDGTIATYEWDWESDGIYDFSSGLPDAGHTYTSVGDYTATLRVTDDDGQQDTATQPITVIIGGSAPTAALSCDDTLGEAPMTVNFDASASSDLDGTLVKFEWDWDYQTGNFTVDEDSGGDSTVQHVFGSGGLSPTLAAVRVTDNHGLSDTAEQSIMVYPNGDYDPVVRLVAAPRYGPVPLPVDFDASESFDIDGAIVSYEWDWNGDGSYDQNTGTDATVTNIYAAAGVFDAAVRVTDNEGRTARKVMLVLATADATFPPDDSIFVLPSQSKAVDGEVVTMEVHTKNAANPFQYMNGCGITFEDGSPYASGTLDAGAIDYTPDAGNVYPTDGVWTAVNPTGFIWFGDSFLFPTDIGGGRVRYDFNITSLGGSNIANATGPLFNFGVTVHSSLTFSFQRISGVKRTYYSEAALAEFYWASDDNAGLPGVTLL